MDFSTSGSATFKLNDSLDRYCVRDSYATFVLPSSDVPNMAVGTSSHQHCWHPGPDDTDVIATTGNPNYRCCHCGQMKHGPFR